MNGRRGVRVVGAVGVALAIAIACGPDVDEKREQVEHRIGPCKTWCDSYYDSECGRQEDGPLGPAPELDHKTAAECVERCADPEYPSFNWARNDDGVDVCKDEWVALAECIPTLSCEQAREFWNAERTSEYPCKEVNKAQASCWTDWAVQEGEG